MSKQGYTDPQLFTYGDDLKKEWYVGFRFTCSTRQQRKPFQVRLRINYQKTVKAREAEGKAVVTLVKQCLEEGWNPFECTIKEYMRALQSEQLRVREEEERRRANDPRYFGFNDALQWAYDKKSIKESTKGGLESLLAFAKEAAIKLGIDKLPIQEINRFFVCELLDQIMTDRQAFYDKSENKRYRGKKVTPNLYNAYLDRLSALFFEYENRGVLEVNPCHKIAKKPPIDFGIHRHPTEKEIAIIKAELPQRHPELYNLLRCEHVTGMRPDEILDVKFNMVDYLNSCINISDTLYNEKGELISKTTAYRQVAVPAFLLEWIRERSVGHDPDEYLFSYKLRPGYHRITRTWISMLWKDVVIDGLGINVSFYSFKGVGGDAKRDAGITLEAVAGSYGHTTTTMARNVYLSKEGERLRKQIIELTPDL